MDSVFKRNRTFFGSPYRITQEQEQNPVSVFHSFFDLMHLYQVREEMEMLKEAILLSTKSFSQEERMDALYTLERLEEFVEAGFVIARKDIEEQTKDKESKNENEAYALTKKVIEMLMEREDDLSQKGLDLLHSLNEAIEKYEGEAIHEPMIV